MVEESKIRLLAISHCFSLLLAWAVPPLFVHLTDIGMDFFAGFLLTK